MTGVFVSGEGCPTCSNPFRWNSSNPNISNIPISNAGSLEEMNRWTEYIEHDHNTVPRVLLELMFVCVYVCLYFTHIWQGWVVTWVVLLIISLQSTVGVYTRHSRRWNWSYVDSKMKRHQDINTSKNPPPRTVVWMCAEYTVRPSHKLCLSSISLLLSLLFSTSVYLCFIVLPTPTLNYMSCWKTCLSLQRPRMRKCFCAMTDMLH